MFIELLSLLFPFISIPRRTMPRTKTIKDDAGADVVASSAPADLSSDVDVIMPEREAPASGLEEVPPPDSILTGDQDTPLPSRIFLQRERRMQNPSKDCRCPLLEHRRLRVLW